MNTVTRAETTEVTYDLYELANSKKLDKSIQKLLTRAIEIIDRLEADYDQQFKELIEANRWQRLYREKFEALREQASLKQPAAKPVLDNSPEARRAQMAKTRAEDMPAF